MLFAINDDATTTTVEAEISSKPRFYSYLLHFSLFVTTFFTTCMAGVIWLNKDPFILANLKFGLPYSISLMTILASHEFGHYFTARYYGLQVTLPYFIPVPPFLINPFGTMGAVIRIRSPLTSKKSLFDVGIGGPIAGLLVTFVVLCIGFLTLPGKEYLYTIHPEYRLTPSLSENGLTLGNSLLLWILKNIFPSSNTFFPPMNEIYHYPFLCAGWFGLFVTAMNLMPIGQLDGGHIMYALIGKMQKYFARAFVIILIGLGLSGLAPLLGFKNQFGTVAWLIWAAILIFVIKLNHPEIYDEQELNKPRRILGWGVLILFIFIFPPLPIYEVGG